MDSMSKLIEPHFIKLHNCDAHLCITIMERYRSGHNGADSKSVCANAHEGSNPSLSAIQPQFPKKSCGFTFNSITKTKEYVSLCQVSINPQNQSRT